MPYWNIARLKSHNRDGFVTAHMKKDLEQRARDSDGLIAPALGRRGATERFIDGRWVATPLGERIKE